MKQFLKEQDTLAKPPEPQGEKTPEEDSSAEDTQWDGSEAELVADDTALAFEEQHTGIRLKYTLTSGEIFKVLRKSQYTTMRIVLSAIAVTLSFAMAVLFLIRLSNTGDNRYGSLAAVCFMLIFVIGALPSLQIKIHSSRIADGHEIHMKIYPDHIEMGMSDKKWEIPLDGTSKRAVFSNLVVLYIDDKNMVILPLRCVDPAVLPEVQAMLFAGTQPEK